MSYASVSDLLKRYDARVIGDLVNDSGTRQTSIQLLLDDNVQASLDDAAGMINSAVFNAERYDVVALNNLTGVDQAFLIRLNCDLAFGLLSMRRGTQEKALPMYEMALDTLERLRTGDRVFNSLPELQAGNVTSEFVSVDNLTRIDLARDEARRYFPIRRDQQIPIL